MNVWGGRRAQAERDWWASRLPLPCLRCRAPVTPGSDWDVGHRVPRAFAPDLQWDRDNQWPEHRGCNRRAGATPVTVDAPPRRGVP